jgi:hypothetical protein
VGKSEVVADGRCDDDHVHGADCGECLGQIGVQIHAVDGGRLNDDPRIDSCDELHSTPLCESGDAFCVDGSIAANSDEDHARRRGGRVGAGARQPLILT